MQLDGELAGEGGIEREGRRIARLDLHLLLIAVDVDLACLLGGNREGQLLPLADGDCLGVEPIPGEGGLALH